MTCTVVGIPRHAVCPLYRPLSVAFSTITLTGTKWKCWPTSCPKRYKPSRILELCYDSLKIFFKKTLFYPTNYYSRFQMQPYTVNNSKNLPELKRLILSITVTYYGRKESGPAKCHLIHMLQSESKLHHHSLAWVRNFVPPQGKLLARRLGPILSPKHNVHILDEVKKIQIAWGCLRTNHR
jgi:hypothetical protein